MSIKQKEISDFLYKNPFDDYNANVLAPDLIMRYWYTPFSTGALKDFDEKKFYSQRMPIILQGSRGSGKTTILKYFSFPVQCERAIRNHTSIKEQIRSDSGVGFYLRCDDSFLDMFKTVYMATLEDSWMSCFEHYLELFFAKGLLDMLLAVVDVRDERPIKTFLQGLNLEKYESCLSFKRLDELHSYISDELHYISKFKNEALFTKAEFSPQHIWSFYDISGAIISEIPKLVPDLSGINYILLIDEFENLPPDLQKKFNTMIKFCKPGMTMRVGRRSENIVTKETINNVEYLRENNDYQLVILDQGQNIQDSKAYLRGIAERRLAAFDGIDLPTNIIELLGEKEDLDSECSSLADGRNLHLKYLLNANPRIKANPALQETIINIIAYPENRIAEMLNALWVSRCAEDEEPIEVAYMVVDAMRSFLLKKEHPLVEKYRNDYNNKYRYALTVVLCAAYKRDKSYYSFNTICYLSEGNARTFINLCKAIINDAIFYEKKNFISSKKVSSESQRRAIKEYSINEFNSVCSIIQNGKAIRELVLSLGNVFSEFHKDRLVRYPETNQFSFNPDELNPEIRKIFDIAESWSIIKKSRDTKRISASVNKEGNLYTINKIFAPIFNISYRTRGGVNIILTADEIELMVAGQFSKSKLNSTGSHKRNSTTKNLKSASVIDQISLFGSGGN